MVAASSGASDPAPQAGPPVVPDPSAAVRALNEAGLQRQDDLRELESSWRDKVAEIREEHSKELRSAEAARLDQLRDAEAKRIDAIRAVDAAQVTRAAEVQAQQALALAAQVATSAETLRSQVAAAATAGTIALNNALEPMQKRIDDLTRAQYEAQGQKTPDLAMAPVLAALERLNAAQNQSVGAKTGQTDMRAWLLAGITVIIAAITIIGFVIANSGQG